MELSPTVLVLLGLFIAVWTVGAIWAVLTARAHSRRATNARKAAQRLSQLLEDSPAVPLLVRADGKIEGSERLAGWLGFDSMPAYLSELGAEAGGLVEADLGQLQQAVKRSQQTAAPFEMSISPRGSSQRLILRGLNADPSIAPAGAALVWFFSEEGGELARLRAEAARNRRDLATLSALVEAAPIPMWLRGGDGQLKLVNRAYADTVGADGSDSVLSKQIELRRGAPGLQTTDVSLPEETQGGFALDLQDEERHARALDAMRQAQRFLLDHVSVAAAQFDEERILAFANQPFRDLFGVEPGVEFGQFLETAHEAGRLPVTRDFATWRGRVTDWFAAAGPQENLWKLSDGTRVRINVRPIPGGGLVLLADQHEQAGPAASRDRAPLLDNLLESLAIVSADGKLTLWNRPFAALWGLPAHLLAGQPEIESLLDRMATKLERRAERGAIGEAVRSALDNTRQGGSLTLRDGRSLAYAAVPLPEGAVLLTFVAQGENPLPEAGPALTVSEIELMPFLTDLVRAREEDIEGRQLTFNLRGDRRIAGRVWGDPERLALAIGSIIDGAIAATPPGGQVLMTLSRRSARARIALWHDGDGGVPDELARSIIEGHGGEIDIADKSGALTLLLP